MGMDTWVVGQISFWYTVHEVRFVIVRGEHGPLNDDDDDDDDDDKHLTDFHLLSFCNRLNQVSLWTN